MSACTRLTLILIALLPLAAPAQTPYASPDGKFTIIVPSGWKVEPDPKISNLVNFRDGAVTVAILVSQQHKSNGMSAQQFINGNQQELKGQCPTFENRQSGPSTLLGYPAFTAIDTCSDPRSPAVAEDFATVTPDSLLIGFTIISPLSRYYEILPQLDAMRSSLRLTNHPTSALAKRSSLGFDAITDLRKACLVGAFTQEDCARRAGILRSQEDPGPTSSTNATIYRDATGRFTVEVPAGWQAIAEGDNGIGGVQLRSGSNWINLMPADDATTPSNLVLKYEQGIVTHSHSTRTPPLGSIGLVQLFGHKLEITYDNFSASSRQGDPVDTYIAGIGDISGTGPHLLLVASLAKQPTGATPVPIFAIAQSIHLGAH